MLLSNAFDTVPLSSHDYSISLQYGIFKIQYCLGIWKLSDRFEVQTGIYGNYSKVNIQKEDIQGGVMEEHSEKESHEYSVVQNM